MRRFLKDPLTHFLTAGAVIFLVGSATKPPPAQDGTIIVDRAALLDFIQYRSKAFEATAAASMLDGFSEDDRAALIRDYVREEAMVREAEGLGLSANDYVIRQRMVQKVEFLAEASTPIREPTDAEISAFYDENKSRYVSPPTVTLTHVFVSTQKDTRDGALAKATSLLQRLRSEGAGFNDAIGFGDRFLFHRNYVDRTADYVLSQLGDEVAKAALDVSTPLGEWRGPYLSQYGYHLIFVTARTSERTPGLDEVRDLVKSDLAEELRQQAIDDSIERIVAKYKVEDRLNAPEPK